MSLIAIGVAAVSFHAVFIARSSFVAFGSRHFTLFDDAMISMRYARNLASGRGLVWNAGEEVEGITNLLWTLWMSLIHLTSLPDRLTSLPVSISGSAIVIATSAVVYHLTRRAMPDAPAWVPIAAFASVATYYPLAFWSLRGMEVGLIGLLLASSTLVALKVSERPSVPRLLLLGGLLSLGFLTRPDFLVVGAAIGVWLLANLPTKWAVRAGCVVGGMVVVVVLATTLWRLNYYGMPVPNTFQLKVGVPLEVRLGRGLSTLSQALAFHLWVLVLFAAPLFVTDRSVNRRGTYMMAGVVASALLYSLWVGGDAWEQGGYTNRYITSVSPILLSLAVMGLATVRHWSERRRTWYWGIGAMVAGSAAVAALLAQDSEVNAAAATVLAVLFLALFVGRTRWLKAPLSVVAVALVGLTVLNTTAVLSWVLTGGMSVHPADARWAQIGLAVRESTPPTTKIATLAAGNIPYFSRRPAVDLLGKADPHIASTPSRPLNGEFLPGHSKWDYAWSVGELQPDLVLQTWSLSGEEQQAFRRWGYQDEPGIGWVHEEAGVDTRELANRIATLSGAQGG